MDVVLPGTLERRSERLREAARRPGLRAETEAPAPPQSAPRAHSESDLETIEEKRAKSSFRAKRTHTLRAQFAVGRANVLLPLFYRLEKHPQVIHRRWRWGVLMPLSSILHFSPPLSTCVYRRALHQLPKGKMANYAHARRAPAARHLSSGARGVLPPQGDTPVGSVLAHAEPL